MISLNWGLAGSKGRSRQGAEKNEVGEAATEATTAMMTTGATMTTGAVMTIPTVVLAVSTVTIAAIV